MWTLPAAGASDRLMNVLRNPERRLAAEGAVLKRSAAVVVWEDDGFVLKRWRPHGFVGMLKGVFRPSHAQRAFALAGRLISAGVATPAPVAVADRARCGLPASSYLIVEKIAAATDLATWQRSGRETMRETAKLLARLHRAGFTHRDLKPTNILFDANGRAHLIDLDGVRRRGRVSDGYATADLTKLARRMVELASLSPREAAVFLRAYCREAGTDSRRSWWRRLRRRLAPYHIPRRSRPCAYAGGNRT